MATPQHHGSSDSPFDSRYSGDTQEQIATCLSCPLPEPKCSSNLCPLQAGKPPKHRKKSKKVTQSNRRG